MSKHAIAALALLVGGVAFAAAPKGGAGGANQLTKAERAAGWRLLFDGKTTKGWRGYKKTEMPPGWTVVDGALTRAAAQAGDILTDAEFQDFELAIDWRIAEGGNSGIMYRVAESEGSPYLTGPEYQVLDDAKHPDAKKGLAGTHKAGALYDLYAPAKDVVRPAGQWNQARIVLKGNHVEHWLNGEKIIEAEIGSPDWNKRVAASKWATAAHFAKMPKGHIDLQDHGDTVEYRNIKVREPEK